MPKGFFDFQEVAKKGDGLDDFIKEAQKNLEKDNDKMKSKPSNGNAGGGFLYIIIGILSLSLIFLGYYSLSNNDNGNEQMVAEAPVEPNNNIQRRAVKVISGQGFSILLDRESPENFEVSENEVDFNFLDNKTGAVTKILAQNGDDSSGIEIYVSEYDNKLDIVDFTKQVHDSLGGNYEIDKTSIEIPKGFRLNRIIDLLDVNSSYYVTATSENYYVIKYDNSARENSELSEYSKFIDQMIENLYLN